jgi:hypothetical protein
VIGDSMTIIKSLFHQTLATSISLAKQCQRVIYVQQEFDLTKFFHVLCNFNLEEDR